VAHSVCPGQHYRTCERLIGDREEALPAVPARPQPYRHHRRRPPANPEQWTRPRASASGPAVTPEPPGPAASAPKRAGRQANTPGTTSEAVTSLQNLAQAGRHPDETGHTSQAQGWREHPPPPPVKNALGGSRPPALPADRPRVPLLSASGPPNRLIRSRSSGWLSTPVSGALCEFLSACRRCCEPVGGVRGYRDARSAGMRVGVA